MEIDKNKPKTLWIKFNQDTHKPEFIGIEEPAEDGSILTILHGDKNTILEPIPVKDCDTCEMYLANKCDPDKTLFANKCPYNQEE
jgi:hypothetical protein